MCGADKVKMKIFKNTTATAFFWSKSVPVRKTDKDNPADNTGSNAAGFDDGDQLLDDDVHDADGYDNAGDDDDDDAGVDTSSDYIRPCQSRLAS